MNYHLPKEEIFGTAYGLHCIDCVEKVKEAAQFPEGILLAIQETVGEEISSLY